jgi:hypothetical protein
MVRHQPRAGDGRMLAVILDARDIIAFVPFVPVWVFVMRSVAFEALDLSNLAVKHALFGPKAFSFGCLRGIKRVRQHEIIAVAARDELVRHQPRAGYGRIHAVIDAALESWDGHVIRVAVAFKRHRRGRGHAHDCRRRRRWWWLRRQCMRRRWLRLRPRACAAARSRCTIAVAARDELVRHQPRAGYGRVHAVIDAALESWDGHMCPVAAAFKRHWRGCGHAHEQAAHEQLGY